MPDMLVNLLNLPPMAPEVEAMRQIGIVIRRPLPHETAKLRAFAQTHFSTGWADEVTVGFANKPASLFIAIRDGVIVGFGAYECTARAFFGPTGVCEHERKKGIGRALLLACLWGLRDMGYVYGIIGSAGPTGFYANAVGAIAIEGSEPGIYANPLK